jgi:hypothetical protein
MTVSDWSKRVKPALNSRHFSLILLFPLALFSNGLAFFLSSQITKGVHFFDDLWVLYLALHSCLMLLLTLAMSIRAWSWRLEQLGVVSIAISLCFFNLFFGAYIPIAIYSSASIAVKLFMWLSLASYSVWFTIKSVVRPLKEMMLNSKIKEKIYVKNETHYIFHQLTEVAAREKLGFKIHCHPFTALLFLLFGITSIFIRKDLSIYFNVEWIVIAHAIFSFPLISLVSSFLVLGLIYLYQARIIFKETRKYIYLNNISKS